MYKIDDEEESRADFFCAYDMDFMKSAKIAAASVEDTEENLKLLS